MKFSDHLRALRGYRTQEELAALMPEGFSVRTLEAWEAERQLPRPWMQAMIISHLQDQIEIKDAVYGRGSW